MLRFARRSNTSDMPIAFSQESPMFGFLRPSCQSTAYRQAYARCCQYQRHHYGVLSLPLLSYEATLLYVLAGDSGTFPRPDSDAPTCCRLRSKAGLRRLPEAPLGQFCASLGLLR